MFADELRETRSFIACLHDSSNEAYAAVTYSEIEYKNVEPSRRLVAAKTEVAPLEAASIPRLELMAAVLAVKLTIPMKKVLEIPEKKIFYWMDSMKSSRTQWNYIKTDDNPADLPSRGYQHKI